MRELGSTDGSEVIYEALGHLYRKSLPDGEVERLTSAEHFELYPQYSRDGEKLVYVSWDDQELGQVIVRDLDSGEETVLKTGGGTFVEPVFSPDGNTVVYRKVGGGYITSDKYGLETGVYHIAWMEVNHRKLPITAGCRSLARVMTAST